MILNGWWFLQFKSRITEQSSHLADLRCYFVLGLFLFSQPVTPAGHFCWVGGKIPECYVAMHVVHCLGSWGTLGAKVQYSRNVCQHKCSSSFQHKDFQSTELLSPADLNQSHAFKHLWFSKKEKRSEMIWRWRLTFKHSFVVSSFDIVCC